MAGRREQNPVVAESAGESLVDRLVSRYKIRDEFIVVTLPDGESMKFRSIRNMTERKAAREAAHRFAELCSRPPMPQWREYFPVDPDIAESLGVIRHLSVEPKLTDLDVLQLHQVPFVVDHISFQLNAGIFRVNQDADAQEIEASKKD